MSDFHNLCRLCLTNNAGNINIFENKISPNIVTTIYATLNIKVSANDSLPKVICHSCTTNVERWYKYSKSCCDNQTKLANMAKKQNGTDSIYNNWRAEIFATLKSGHHVEEDDYEKYASDNDLQDEDDEIYSKPAVKFQNGLTIIALPNVKKDNKDATPKSCRICHKQFENLKSALSHEKYAHTRAEILTIDLTDSKKLQEYNNDVVRNILKTKTCSFCQRKIPKSHNMLFHLRSVHMKIPTSFCHYCNIRLPPVEYKAHIKNCPVRNADFSKKIVPKEENVSTASPPEPTNCKKMLYKCRKCDEKYPYKKAFYVHIQENHILPNNATNCPIECEHCLRNFLYHADYRAHFSIDSCLLQLVCENCNQFFETMRLFRVHSCEEVEVAEDKSDYKYSCSECGSLFKTLEQWTDHRANHLSYNCTICKTKFFDYLQLKEHLKAHSVNCVNKPKVTAMQEDYDDDSTPQRSEDEDDSYMARGYEKDEDYEDERRTESPNYEPFDKAAYLEKYPNARECNICHKFLSGNASLYKHKRIHKRAARLEQEMYESLDDNQMAALKSIQLPGLTVTSTSINQRLKTEECCVCKNFFSTKDSLRHHLRTQHKDFYYSNKLFQSNMFTRPNLESLLKKNTAFNPYNSNSKSTMAHSSRDEYNDERLRRSLKLKYQHKNSVLFSKFTNRKFDMPMKKGGNFHKCELCGKKYVKKRSIVYHKINFHKMSEVEAITGSPKATKTYTCQECSKVFYTLPSLNGHLSWHDQMKKNAETSKGNNASNGIDCALCGTHHHNITELRQHILSAHKSQTETVEKNCVCKLCKMVFKDDEKLTEHMEQFHKDDETPTKTPIITVTDLKKLVNPTCSICKITFETKSALQEHALKCHTSKSSKS